MDDLGLPPPMVPADCDLRDMPVPWEEIAIALAPQFGLTAEQALNYVAEMRKEGEIL